MNRDFIIFAQFTPQELRETLKTVGVRPNDAKALTGMLFPRRRHGLVRRVGMHDALAFLRSKELVAEKVVPCGCQGPCGEVYLYVKLIENNP